MAITDKNADLITYWEFDKGILVPELMNHSGGIWKYCLSPGVITFVDDNANTGYYGYTNATMYNINSLTIDGVIYLKVNDLVDLETRDEAFYYDDATTFIYITFTNYENWLQQNIFAGASFSYSNKENSAGNFIGGSYYKELITSISNIKKSKDPLFYGLLKYNVGTVKLLNTEGEFDAWRDKSMYRQPTRLYVGENGGTYAQLVQVGSGVIGEHSRSWSEFSIKIQDSRTVLTNKIPKNRLTTAIYPYLSDSNVDRVIPLAYGSVNNAPCACLNENQGGATFTFMVADTEYNALTSIGVVKVAGVVKSVNSSDTAAGTFVLSSANVDGNFGEVTCSFVAPISNGVEIIKDIMSNYAYTDYIDEYYDLVETAAAVTECNNRSAAVYVKEESDVKKIIEQICVDIDGLFFQKDNGLWTVRTYNPLRTPVTQIYFDEIIKGRSIEGNEDQFLSSVVVKYNKNHGTDSWSQYENTNYENVVFQEYKTLQTKTFETGLTNEASAILKSNSIMEFSQYIEDIVKITVPFKFYTLEIMDFVICDPRRRESETDTLGVWEVIEIAKDFNKFNITLTLKFIELYSLTPSHTFYLVDDSGNYIIDESDNIIVIVE